MRKIVLFIMAISFFSCNKTIDLSLPTTATESRLNTPVASAVLASAFNLSSFTVAKGNVVKWGKCRVATSLIQWTATGETYISQYEVQKSFTNDFSSLTTESTVAGSTSDLSINRSYVNTIFGNGQTLTLYYRLKIYYRTGAISFGPVASITIQTIRCDMSGF